MSSSIGGEAIYEHGTTLDHLSNRVRCKYCDKVVNGYNRLKHHLGGVGPDVVSCMRVPDAIKLSMKNSLLEKKKEKLLKEVGDLYHPQLPLKRDFSSLSSEPRYGMLRPSLLTSPANVNSASENASSSHVEPTQKMDDEKPGLEELGVGRNTQVPGFVKNEYVNVIVDEEAKDESALLASKCIGRFFYEAGIDINNIKLPSFRRMIDVAITRGPGFKVPMCEELKGWILESEFKDVQGHVNEVRRSWERTGCSILLDRWTDQQGRTLIAFLVDCPKGTIFLRSVDASDVINDANELSLLLSTAIEEVGPRNVVQVITHDPYQMEAAGKKLVVKHNSVFWTLCVDQCINLTLESFASIDQVKQVLDEAKSITRFIYSHMIPLELMRKHIRGKELIKTSRLKSVAAFMTLENMNSERENLMHMFNSPDWKFSMWASRSKGKTICELVKNPLFWDSVGALVKVTNPLIGVLHMINSSDTAPIGFLYESMDQAKEEISRNLGGQAEIYDPYWAMIDDIWDNYLHSQLHAAAYYLNPGLFHSKKSFIDSEVTNGIICAVIRMLENQSQLEMVQTRQLDSYSKLLGDFGEEAAIDQMSIIPPADWWALHGAESPQLQKFAIKILSQTCTTSSRYKLKKHLSEQLHTKGINRIEQQKLADLEFVQNNLRLWHVTDDFELEEQKPMDDWIVEC